MRKTVLTLSLVTLIAFTSCKGDKKEEVKEETKTEVKAEEPKKEEAPAQEETSSDVPKFDNADVQAYVDAYEKYMADYAAIVESKDMTKMAELGTKAQDLATKGQEAMKKLSGDDVKKLTDYMTKKGQEVQELAKKLTGQ